MSQRESCDQSQATWRISGPSRCSLQVVLISATVSSSDFRPLLLRSTLFFNVTKLPCPHLPSLNLDSVQEKGFFFLFPSHDSVERENILKGKCFLVNFGPSFLFLHITSGLHLVVSHLYLYSLVFCGCCEGRILGSSRTSDGIYHTNNFFLRNSIPDLLSSLIFLLNILWLTCNKESKNQTCNRCIRRILYICLFNKVRYLADL